MRNFQINIIRKAAGELLDAIEAYSAQLAAVPNEYRRKQLLAVCLYLAERLRDLAMMIGNDDGDVGNEKGE